MPPKIHKISQLLEKMVSQDQDSRFMALNDLMAEVAQYPGILTKDEPYEVQVLNQVLILIEDQSSEVRNQAVKCLGQLIRIVREDNLNIVVDKLVELFNRPQDELRDVAGLALKTVIPGLPSDGKSAHMACIEIFPKLLEQLQNSSTPPEIINEILSTISVFVTRFPRQIAMTQLDYVAVIAPLLTHARPLVRKSAIVTLAQCLPIVSKKPFDSLLKRTIIPALSPGTELNQQRTIVQLLGCVARNSPDTLGPVLEDVISGVLDLAKRDDNESKEVPLETMETLVLQCPSEITSYLPQILAISTELVKYDPNYAVDTDDGDEDMEDADDDGDAADYYSDDNDTSSKVRYSATKVIAAIVGTRPELLSSVYKSVSPVLASRFGDREETVKLELWSTYEALIKQTGKYGEVQQTMAGEDIEGKPEDGTDTPYVLLKSQVPHLSKALLKQLQPKSSPATLLAGFTLLQSLLVVLPGSLSMSADSIMTISASVLSLTSDTTNSTLHATVIAVLTSFFSMHPSESFQSFLPGLTPQLLNAASQRHPRVTTEALRSFSALLTALKPINSGEWVDKLYAEVVARLKSNDMDPEIRQCTEGVVVDLWVCAFAVVNGKGGAEWDALMRGGRTDGAVQVITRVAANVDMAEAWVTACINWAISLLKKPKQTGKVNLFSCLEVLLRRHTYTIPDNLPGELVPLLQTFLSLTDLVLLTHALITLSILLSRAPKKTLPLMERSVMPTVYKISYSPLLSGASLEAMSNVLDRLVTADRQISMHVVLELVLAMEQSGDADASPATVSKCISAIAKGYPDTTDWVITEFSKAIMPGTKSKEWHVVLSLMTLGEIGRTTDMQKQPEVFNNALTFFTGETEALRTAAAFATGNITAGSVPYFFSLLIDQLQQGSKKQLVSLYALKEVTSHCPRGHRQLVAGQLWKALSDISDTKEETIRNAAAACFGQLTMFDPSQYLRELKGRLTDPSASVKATVMAAICYTFADNTQPYDNLLLPLIEQLMALVLDKDLTIRRLSLSTLNAAARNKPHLIKEYLPTLMPLLYGETVLKPNLVEENSGHRWDRGLEIRKAAYETLSTILDTCVDQSDLHEFLNHVLIGLKDNAIEIKMLCNMMLSRLAQLKPAAVAQRLDDAVPGLKNAPKINEKTPKEDRESAIELESSTRQAIVALREISGGAGQAVFETMMAKLRI